MTAETNDIWDDLFLGCAFAAYVDQSIEEGGTPSRERTRIRAYRYYEDELAIRNGRKQALPTALNTPAAKSAPDCVIPDPPPRFRPDSALPSPVSSPEPRSTG